MADYLMPLFKLLGSLALLIYGMKTMSDSLQKMTGSHLRHVLGAMTAHRLTGVLTGMVVTVAVQSSAATTVMTVSFVNAGLLTLCQAISVIMGANIGTTLTAWIMSAGFSFSMTDFVWPVFVLAIYFLYSRRKENVAGLLFGAAFIFFALGTLSASGREMDLANNESVVRFFASFDSGSYSTLFIFLLIGTVLTCMVQSSAALMALTMVLCTSGVLPIYQGIALVLGENIGTTLTANLAALSSNVQARRAALAHLFFNTFGVAWMLCVFYPFVDTLCHFLGITAAEAAETPERLSFVLAAFHTSFNLINTCVLIWFVPQIAALCGWVIREPKTETSEPQGLKYIQRGLISTPEIALMQAQQEVALFGTRMTRMFGMDVELLKSEDEKEREKLKERLEKYENIADNMETEIAQFLDETGAEHLSDESKMKLRCMLRQVGELESVGDSCYKLCRIMTRYFDTESNFNDTQQQTLAEVTDAVSQMLLRTQEVLDRNINDQTISQIMQLENLLNAKRDRAKKQNMEDVNERLYDYALGTLYVDFVNECERIGDYLVNVVEARFR